MNSKTVLAFDLETTKLASEVEAENKDTLQRNSSWTRPDLFGYGCGVTVNVETGEANRFGLGQATAMIGLLKEADLTVGYNTAVEKIEDGRGA